MLCRPATAAPIGQCRVGSGLSTRDVLGPSTSSAVHGPGHEKPVYERRNISGRHRSVGMYSNMEVQ